MPTLNKMPELNGSSTKVSTAWETSFLDEEPDSCFIIDDAYVIGGVLRGDGVDSLNGCTFTSYSVCSE